MKHDHDDGASDSRSLRGLLFTTSMEVASQVRRFGESLAANSYSGLRKSYLAGIPMRARQHHLPQSTSSKNISPCTKREWHS